MNPVVRFFECADRTPDALAVAGVDASFTFGEMADSVRRVAAKFAQQGIRAGSIVGVNLRPEVETVATLALLQVGAVSLRVTEPIMRGYAGDIDVLVTHEVIRGAGSTRTVMVDTGFAETLGATAPRHEIAELADDDLCRIVFSSGTTGTPKGVPFTTKYLTDRVDSARRNWIPAVPFMSFLGLDTVTGFQTFMWAMFTGETYFVTAGATANIAHLTRHGVKAIKTSPARLNDVLAAITDADRAAIALDVVEVAGSLLTVKTVTDCQILLGVTPTYLYGSTEVGTVTRGFADPANPAMVGTVVDEIDAEIVDDTGAVLPVGVEGILRFRKPGMPTGYWKIPTPTGHSGFRDAWFYPGDYGNIDDVGQLWLAGRRDDLVNAGGAKFNLLELDQWLQDCGLFLDAASFQFVDNAGNTTVGIAFVTKNPPEPSILTARVKEFLPDLVFGALVRMAEIPRNQLGKVERVKLSSTITPSKGPS
jgi:acyl-coenzyme A synthetase/AMP-(fatty) acid ligase